MKDAGEKGRNEMRWNGGELKGKGRGIEICGGGFERCLIDLLILATGLHCFQYRSRLLYF